MANLDLQQLVNARDPNLIDAALKQQLVNRLQNLQTQLI